MKKIILMSMSCLAMLSTSSLVMAMEPFKSKYYLYDESLNPNADTTELFISALTSLDKRDIFIGSVPNTNATVLDLIDYVNMLNSNAQNNVNQIHKTYDNMMASQIAVSNLFQPYSVGKLNLTAAVGQYRSSSSIAVGTGYRFNENVAARASVSFVKGGRTGFGAGVNFEY